MAPNETSIFLGVGFMVVTAIILIGTVLFCLWAAAKLLSVYQNALREVARVANFATTHAGHIEEMSRKKVVAGERKWQCPCGGLNTGPICEACGKPVDAWTVKRHEDMMRAVGQDGERQPEQVRPGVSIRAGIGS